MQNRYSVVEAGRPCWSRYTTFDLAHGMLMERTELSKAEGIGMAWEICWAGTGLHPRGACRDTALLSAHLPGRESIAFSSGPGIFNVSEF